MVFANTFDVTTPAGGSAANLGDDTIRSHWAAILERLLVEHGFPTGTAGSARHKFAIGNTAARPADPNTGTIYINTQTATIEYYTGAAWASAVNVNLAAYLLLAGGTMSGEITFPNTLGIRGKETGGTSRRLLAVSAINRIEVGGVSNILNLLGSGDINHYDGALNRKVWDDGNDGSGSGLDADLIKGQNVGLVIGASSPGYYYFTTTGGPWFQWGQTFVGIDTSVTVTLPLAYTTLYLAIASQATNDNHDGNVGAAKLSNSQITVFNRSASGARTISWFTVGV